MIKTDSWIKHFAESGGITPYTPSQVSAASYDVTLGNHWIYYEDAYTRNKPISLDADEKELHGDRFYLMPGKVVLATTQEVFNMPKDVMGFLTLKSSLARLFLNHMNSNLINPNFSGKITLEFHNTSSFPIELKKGQAVSQIIFMQLEKEPEGIYLSKYQKQDTTTRSK